MLRISVLLIGLLWHMVALSAVEESELFNRFIDRMVTQHQFEDQALRQVFQAVEIRDDIIKTMNRPAEAMPWYKYRAIFMTDQRIRQGVEFWQQHADTLERVATETGVPAQILVAILGVETYYGARTGSFRVIDALSTLGFNYPKRSEFFLQELENFLLLCRLQNLEPTQPTGSYAGAMGIPQFMPSSYLSYAADFDQDGIKDIWKNPADAIASVANYFVRHHWQSGQPVAYLVKADGDAYTKVLTRQLKPHLAWSELEALGVKVQSQIESAQQVTLLEFEMPEDAELWVGLDNFYVITRYNHSPLYALAVFQLSERLLQDWESIHPAPIKVETQIVEVDKDNPPESKQSEVIPTEAADKEPAAMSHE